MQLGNEANEIKNIVEYDCCVVLSEQNISGLAICVHKTRTDTWITSWSTMQVACQTNRLQLLLSSLDSPREKRCIQCDQFFTSLGLSDEKPVTEHLCCCISPYVGVKWKLVLRKLSIEEAIIRNLEEDHKNASVQERCYQGLLVWKDNRGPQGATIKALCHALRLAKCSEALNALQREISPRSSDC